MYDLRYIVVIFLNMIRIIDSEVVIKAYFNKNNDKNNLKFEELKRIRHCAEPKVNAYIDVTYASLMRFQRIHPKAIMMDNIQISLIEDSFRKINEQERPDVELITQFL